MPSGRFRNRVERILESKVLTDIQQFDDEVQDITPTSPPALSSEPDHARLDSRKQPGNEGISGQITEVPISTGRKQQTRRNQGYT